MAGWAKVVLAASAVAVAVVVVACGEKKDPLVPDNPNADPLMMDGGATPTPAAPASS